MLPLRLSLEGFLSYRDRVEFDFSSSRLWMLCGPNGAGKSSVFDALRWAIYGAHRAGKQNAELLVHHESARLRVEADLQLGERVFRLVRTLGRDGARPTWQVRQKIGDDWQDVPETAMKTDYERWVAHNIGLSDEAFCAAVYLAQGHADAILNPDPQARYDLLSQLVDLRVYEGWHAHAEERRQAARVALGEARKRWETAPLPDESELELARQQARELASKREGLSARERALDAMRGDAARWGNWQSALEKLNQSADEKRVLLGDASAIERDFARYQFLQREQAPLNDLGRLVERDSELQSELAQLKAQLEEAKQASGQTESQLQLALEQEKAALGAARQTLEAANALALERAHLAPGEEELARLQRLREELAANARQLAELAAPSEEELRTLREQRDASREVARLLPAWRRFRDARQIVRETSALLAASDVRSGELNAQIVLATGEQDAAKREAQACENAWDAAREVETRTQARLEATRQSRDDFARVEGEARCHFCGQELSPEHARAEAARLEDELARAHTEHERAQGDFEAAHDARAGAKNCVQIKEKAVAALENQLAEQRLQVALTTQKRDAALTSARSAWDELETARSPVWPEQADDFDFALEAPRPDASDLAMWEKGAGQKSKLERAVTLSEQKQREQELLLRSSERAKRDLAPLESKWSSVAASEWHARWKALESEQKAALRAREEASQQEQKKKKNASDCAVRQKAAQSHEAPLAARIGSLEGEALALARQIADAWPAVERAIREFDALETPSHSPITEPDASSTPRNVLTGAPEVSVVEPGSALENQQTVAAANNGSAASLLETLRVLTKTWKKKWQGLQDQKITSRHAELQQARAELERIVGESAFLKRAIEELPEPARRSPSELESELSRARDELKEVELSLRQLEPEIARREREHSEGARLETEMQTREREHDLASELARLLGPRQLQRHLLREAERAIVREANSVLEAISGGTLRLELRTEGDEATGAKLPKVLDVVCHHLSGSAHSRPVEPPFLSGSQRFRVAVALALGIGRTAARGATGDGATRVETILIDEGFGSLDKTGRDEMQGELRLLGHELGRIILVSHQEDFAQGFPARFDISMEQGVSRAQRIVE